MKRFLNSLLPLLIGLPAFADYQVDVDLGILLNGVTEIDGTTASFEIDPGPPPVTIGGRDNATFPRGLDLIESANWGNEVVYQFELLEPTRLSLTSIEIDGDLDFFLHNSLSTEFDPDLSKQVATGAVGAAFLDGNPPISELLAAVQPGVYYLSVENFDGFDGNTSPGDSSFSIGISVNSATPEDLAIDLGVLAVAQGPFTVDTQDSNFDTELALYTSSGAFLAESDDTLGGTSSGFAFRQGLPAGSYFLVLAGNDVTFGPDLSYNTGGEVGDWVFNFPPTPGHPQGVEQGTTTAGSLARESQVFRFTISEPPAEFTDLGQIALGGESFSIDTFGSSFDTEVAFFDRRGIFLTTDDDSNELGESELTFAQGLSVGDYYLAVGGFPTGFNDAFSAFIMPGETETAAGSLVLNYPDQGSGGVSNVDLASGAQQWFRFSVVEEFSASDLIKIVSVDFDPAAQEFTLAWESDLPGPFNIHIGTGAELEAAGNTPGGLLDLVLSGVTSPVVVSVPQDKIGSERLFVQVGR